MGLTQDSAITYVQDRYAASSTLAYAGSTDPNSEPGFFGPNLEAASDVSAAPEPSAWGALGFVVLGITALTLKARRRAAAVTPSPTSF